MRGVNQGADLRTWFGTKLDLLKKRLVGLARSDQALGYVRPSLSHVAPTPSTTLVCTSRRLKSSILAPRLQLTPIFWQAQNHSDPRSGPVVNGPNMPIGDIFNVQTFLAQIVFAIFPVVDRGYSLGRKNQPPSIDLELIGFFIWLSKCVNQLLITDAYFIHQLSPAVINGFFVVNLAVIIDVDISYIVSPPLCSAEK
jgi:hypothetical protein